MNQIAIRATIKQGNYIVLHVPQPDVVEFEPESAAKILVRLIHRSQLTESRNVGQITSRRLLHTGWKIAVATAYEDINKVYENNWLKM
jgi:hypothetical protein